MSKRWNCLALISQLQITWNSSYNREVKKCILYNQRVATYTMFFIIISALHVSGGFSAHHQELIKLYEGSNFNSGNYLFTTDTK